LRTETINPLFADHQYHLSSTIELALVYIIYNMKFVYAAAGASLVGSALATLPAIEAKVLKAG
jgi:hypothetical protein